MQESASWKKIIPVLWYVGLTDRADVSWSLVTFGKRSHEKCITWDLETQINPVEVRVWVCLRKRSRVRPLHRHTSMETRYYMWPVSEYMNEISPSSPSLHFLSVSACLCGSWPRALGRVVPCRRGGTWGQAESGWPSPLRKWLRRMLRTGMRNWKLEWLPSSCTAPCNVKFTFISILTHTKLMLLCLKSARPMSLCWTTAVCLLVCMFTELIKNKASHWITYFYQNYELQTLKRGCYVEIMCHHFTILSYESCVKCCQNYCMNFWVMLKSGFCGATVILTFDPQISNHFILETNWTSESHRRSWENLFHSNETLLGRHWQGA